MLLELSLRDATFLVPGLFFLPRTAGLALTSVEGLCNQAVEFGVPFLALSSSSCVTLGKLTYLTSQSIIVLSHKMRNSYFTA